MFYEALQLSAYTFCIVLTYHYEMILFILSNIHYFLVFGHLMDFSALPDTVISFPFEEQRLLASVAHTLWVSYPLDFSSSVSAVCASPLPLTLHIL